MSVAVTLSFPTGQRRDVLLAGVPHVGDHIRLKGDAATAPSWVVRQVLWMEVCVPAEPHVIAVISPYSEAIG